MKKEIARVFRWKSNLQQFSLSLHFSYTVQKISPKRIFILYSEKPTAQGTYTKGVAACKIEKVYLIIMYCDKRLTQKPFKSRKFADFSYKNGQYNTQVKARLYEPSRFSHKTEKQRITQFVWDTCDNSSSINKVEKSNKTEKLNRFGCRLSSKTY